MSGILADRRYNADGVVELSTLQELIASPVVKRRCAAAAARLQGVDALEEACDHIEKMIAFVNSSAA